jgi:chorismate mutase
MKGIRGAAGVTANTKEAILEATCTLLQEIVQRNHLDPAEVVSALFTLTPDLNAAFPAAAARTMGWVDVPLICAQEIPVPEASPSIVRVLLLVNRDHPVQHVYLGSARGLRPDLAGPAARPAAGTGATEGEDKK